MGLLLFVVGLAVLGFGFWNHLKAKRILAAPFKKTGELSRNPVSEDPKGAMSTEGTVRAAKAQVLAPCSQVPCLYFEVKIERLWEKTETTAEGTKTSSGATTLDMLKGGAVFDLDDGSGAISVDFSKGGDFDMLKEGFKKELNGRAWSSNVKFGALKYDVPPLGSSDGHTIGFRATERFVPVDGKLFVLGKLEGARLVKPGWRSMMASSQGRDGLLSGVAKKRKLSFIGGAVAAVASLPLMIFAPAAVKAEAGQGCARDIENVRARCADDVKTSTGTRHAWQVTKPGRYEIAVFVAGPNPFSPRVKVTDENGKVLAHENAGANGRAVAQLEVPVGKYTVLVQPADGTWVAKSSFGFELEIRRADARADARR